VATPVPRGPELPIIAFSFWTSSPPLADSAFEGMTQASPRRLLSGLNSPLKVIHVIVADE